jgi:hypothetical protein
MLGPIHPPSASCLQHSQFTSLFNLLSSLDGKKQIILGGNSWAKVYLEQES